MHLKFQITPINLKHNPKSSYKFMWNCPYLVHRVAFLVRHLWFTCRNVVRSAVLGSEQAPPCAPLVHRSARSVRSALRSPTSFLFAPFHVRCAHYGAHPTLPRAIAALRAPYVSGEFRLRLHFAFAYGARRATMAATSLLRRAHRALFPSEMRPCTWFEGFLSSFLRFLFGFLFWISDKLLEHFRLIVIICGAFPNN